MSEWLLEWIPNIMGQLGYFGIALLMFLENLFPPIPSELIMPLAGFSVSRGDMAFAPVIVAGVVGTVLGTYPWYYIGKFLNEEKLEHFADKYGKWISVSAKDIHKANNWFNRHGGKAVFLCRLVPGVRTLISLPAGINGMPLTPFTLYTTAGTTIWVLFLTGAGYKLGDHYDLVNKYLGPISKIALISLAIFFIFWVLLKRLRQTS
jgi:membrane protein DedA with SNARE-associated domain